MSFATLSRNITVGKRTAESCPVRFTNTTNLTINKKRGPNKHGHANAREDRIGAVLGPRAESAEAAGALRRRVRDWENRAGECDTRSKVRHPGKGTGRRDWKRRSHRPPSGQGL